MKSGLGPPSGANRIEPRSVINNRAAAIAGNRLGDLAGRAKGQVLRKEQSVARLALFPFPSDFAKPVGTHFELVTQLLQ